jgi:hypothetical protein
MRMVAVAVVTLSLVTSSHAAPPPPYMPLCVTGDICTGTATLKYVAVWSNVEEGYYFSPPGHPGGWTQTHIRAERADGGVGDYTGNVTFEGVSADWTNGPLGRSLEWSTYSFSPTSVDHGTGWNPYRTAQPIWWGVTTGLIWDITFAVYALAYGELLAALRHVYD